MSNKIDFDFEQYKQAMLIIDQCTDDYFFVYNLQQDYFTISSKAASVFSINKTEFFNAGQTLRTVILQQDWNMLCEDIKRIQTGVQQVHDLEFRVLSKKGKYNWVGSRGKVICEGNKPLYLVGRVAEIGKQSKYDNTTGLYCENVLEQDYLMLQSKSHENGFVLVLGIDNFKEINEKYGYQIGNGVLESVARCIVKCTGKKRYVYRLKGDEFAVIGLETKDDECDKARTIYKQIRSTVDQFIEKSGYQIFYTISGGAASFDTQTDSFELLMRNIRFALHCAKMNGKNTFVAFSQEKYDQYIRKLDIQEDLRYCIEHDFEGFEIYYQPIMKPDRNLVCGAEALIRWKSKKYGFMSPVDFVPLLEESSLIIPLGRWIIDKAVKQCHEWLAKIPDFVMNINLSFIQIIKSDILKDAMSYIDQYGVEYKHIVFELTESGEIENNRAVRNVLNSFCDRGIKLAIDDFGTGYSNLRYIRDMTFGIIKIDREFIRNINQSEDNYQLVKSVVDMAHTLNIMVCIEGVETEEELERVTTLNPDSIQGFLYGCPMPALEFTNKFLAISA